MKVLLVEDCPADARLVKEAIKECPVGASVEWALSAEEALTKLTAPRPARSFAHLVLLDLNLQGMTGLELLTILKTTPSTQKIPIVVLTSSTAASDVRAAYEANANVYMVKPTDFTGYVDLMGALLAYWSQHARLPAEAL